MDSCRDSNSLDIHILTSVVIRFLSFTLSFFLGVPLSPFLLWTFVLCTATFWLHWDLALWTSSTFVTQSVIPFVAASRRGTILYLQGQILASAIRELDVLLKCFQHYLAKDFAPFLPPFQYFTHLFYSVYSEGKTGMSLLVSQIHQLHGLCHQGMPLFWPGECWSILVQFRRLDHPLWLGIHQHSD